MHFVAVKGETIRHPIRHPDANLRDVPTFDTSFPHASLSSLKQAHSAHLLLPLLPTLPPLLKLEATKKEPSQDVCHCSGKAYTPKCCCRRYGQRGE